MQNLRWDFAADLERVFPPPLARGAVRPAAALAAGVRRAVQGLGALRARLAVADGRPMRQLLRLIFIVFTVLRFGWTRWRCRASASAGCGRWCAC
jgi:hypothetical protein